jgi:CheY-like chemotaxis protein
MAATLLNPVQTCNILVVDDFGPVARLLADTLQRVGYQAECVQSGKEALKICQTEHFDLVICDIVMPGMDGWELMRQLKACGVPRGIAVSALHAAEHKNRSREAGFSMHLSKPVDLEELMEAIDTVLKPEGLP